VFILDHFGKEIIGQTFGITESIESDDFRLGVRKVEAKEKAKAKAETKEKEKAKAKAEAKEKVTHPMVKSEFKIHGMSG